MVANSPCKRRVMPFLSIPLDQALEQNNELILLQSVKTNCQLFMKLYIGCQSRDSDLDEFFHMKVKALLLRYLTAEESGQTPDMT